MPLLDRLFAMLLPPFLVVGLMAVLPAAAVEPPPAEGLIASPEPDWPQWRGPRRDGHSAETGLLARWPEAGPPLLWKFTALGQGWSSPIVVGDSIYITGDIGDDLVIFALDHRGRVRWKTTNGANWTRPYPGARAACVYSEGRLYHLNAHGRLACLDASHGREHWHVDVLERFGAANITWALSECLLIDGPRVIVTPGGPQTMMVALDKRSGVTLWKSAPVEDDQAGYASPVLFRFGGRRILSNCSSRHGFGVDADSGKLLWAVPVENQYKTNVASPVYGGGSIYYATAYAQRGQLFQLAGAADGVTATLAWKSPMDSVTGGAILVGDRLYGAGYSKPKSWFVLDWATGQTRQELPEMTTGAAIYADGHLYCQEDNGAATLLALDAGGPAAIAGRIRLTTEKVRDAWAHPVLCGGRLYLRYHDTLWCYQVRR